MRKPIVLNHAIRITSALALLVSVMTSPIRPNVTRGISHPTHLRRNFGVPGKAPAHRSHIPVNARVVQVKAVSSETKFDCMESTPSRFGLSYLIPLAFESTPASIPFHLDRTSHAPRC